MTRLSSRDETRPEPQRCAAAGCDNPIIPAPTGRPARFCCTACRTRTHRQRRVNVPAIAEADMGSASSRGRPVDQAWLVRLRRGNNAVVVAIGHRRATAERLAQQINELLADPA